MASTNRPVGVIFDFDGTLADTMPALRDRAMELLTRTGITEATAALEYQRTFGAPFINQLQEFAFPPYGLVDIAREFEDGKLDILAKAKPFPDTFSTLAALQTAGYFTGVVSSTERSMVKKFQTAHGLPLHAVYGLDKYHSPKGQQIADMVYVHDLDPDKTIFVGDAPRDAEYARIGEVRFLGVEHTVDRSMFQGVGADSVPTIGHVVRYIRENA